MLWKYSQFEQSSPKEQNSKEKDIAKELNMKQKMKERVVCFKTTAGTPFQCRKNSRKRARSTPKTCSSWLIFTPSLMNMYASFYSDSFRRAFPHTTRMERKLRSLNWRNCERNMKSKRNYTTIISQSNLKNDFHFTPRCLRVFAFHLSFYYCFVLSTIIPIHQYDKSVWRHG